MIDPRRLGVLQAVAAHGSVAGAAGALHLRDLAGRPWVAGPPGTACDHALRRLAAEAAIVISAADVCVEFPSVLALVAAGRGAAVIPQMALGQGTVTVCALPLLGGRHIAAWHQAGPAQPAPATATVLDALVHAAQALHQASSPAR
jgi:DNA-binding transcriptional LysR family regulator